MPTPIATIILAAGESRRLGSPKQLLRLGNSTLIRRAADAAVGAELGPVIVVLGARAKDVSAELSDTTVNAVFNEDWELGMHSSIRCGVEAVEQLCPSATAAILMTCDQPCVSAETLHNLARAFHTDSPPAVACSYAGTLGVPALFDRTLFHNLKILKQGGAKSLIRELGTAVLSYPFPEAELDIDTYADYRTSGAVCGVRG